MSKSFWIQKQNFGPRPRIHHSIVYDPERRKTILFGGDSITKGLLNDTWEWNGKNWIQLTDIGPSPRSKHSMIYDSLQKRVVLFGGNTGDGYDDGTWEWNGTNWIQIANAGPSSRAGHAMVFDSTRGKLILFGGESIAHELLKDTWEWNGTVWIQVESFGPARARHVMIFDSAQNELLLFGGFNAESSLGDTWKWDGSRWIEVTSFGPTQRIYSTTAFNGLRTALFGGCDLVNKIYGDTWQWSHGRWYQESDMGPSARWGHGMTYDTSRSVLILFGGTSSFPQDGSIDSQKIHGDTWELEWSGEGNVIPGETQPADNQPDTPGDVIGGQPSTPTMLTAASFQISIWGICADPSDSIYITCGGNIDAVYNSLQKLLPDASISQVKIQTTEKFVPGGITIDTD
ncbi:MAG TPA: kelch repeat-containing protein, partial [Chitinophagaceae bacterium]|nr:kelch repeat-containing protein [Chitinophagaceae bacterium]